MAKVCPSCELTYSDEDYFCAADGSPLRSTGAEPDNLVGTVIADRYRVEAILGEGGMGRVYRARHVRVPREAAIKVLRRALIADSYAIAAFNREARNAASVGDHPNVAAVYDFGETADGLVFLAMEFIEGETLTRRLEREPVVPAPRVAEIVRQIASGLTAAHELPEPVVHRDLKPDNILLKATRDGSDWVKIVDFGIAKAAKRDTQMLTTPGLVVGTPRYMSPEQLTGGTIDNRSDIYALGMIAFQMLTGRMPFASSSRDEESTIQWALQRLTVQPMTLEQVRPDLPWPPAAQGAVGRALATAAADRTPTANEFARSLARAFGLSTPTSVVGVSAMSPGPLSSAVQAAAQSTAPTAPLTAATSAPALQTRVMTPTTPPSVEPVTGPRDAAPSQPRRSVAMAGIAGGVVVLAVVVGLFWQRRASGDNPPPQTVLTNDSVGRADSGAITSGNPPNVGNDSVVNAKGPDTTASVVASTKSKSGDAAERTRSGSTETSSRSNTSTADAAATRGTLDRVKAALADPDAVVAAGNGEKILQDITRLLPRLSNRPDSVEATYYAVEANLILERPAAACRLLGRIRAASRGTEFEGRVDVLATNADLDCANRR